MLNQVILETRVVKNEGIKYSNKGNAYLALVLAFETLEKKENTYQTKSNFIQSVLWGKRAESLAEKIKPGTPLIVRGKLEQKDWQTKEGEKRRTFSLLLEDIHFSHKKSYTR